MVTQLFRDARIFYGKPDHESGDLPEPAIGICRDSADTVVLAQASQEVYLSLRDLPGFIKALREFLKEVSE